MNQFDYFALVRKSDGAEVYSSPTYCGISFGISEDKMSKIRKNLNFYFERVNSGIEQQLNSPKTTEEQKKSLKFLDKNDYVVKLTRTKELGCRFQKVYSTTEAVEFLKENN